LLVVVVVVVVPRLLAMEVRAVRAATPMVQQVPRFILVLPGVVLHNPHREVVATPARLGPAFGGPMAAAPVLAKTEVMEALVGGGSLLTLAVVVVVVVVLVMPAGAVVLPCQTAVRPQRWALAVAVARLGQATALPTSPIQQLQALPMALSPSLITSN